MIGGSGSGGGLQELQDSDAPSEGEGSEEDIAISGKVSFEPVTMIMNDRDFIYYVTK
jgi:hypothetical protein